MQRLFNSNTSYEFRNGALGLNIRKLPLWTPSAITTNLWLDAADASTITLASGVSQWRDKSGGAKHAVQATGGSQPAYLTADQNGLNVLSFNGSSSVMTHTYANSTTNTSIFIVSLVNSQGIGYRGLFSTNGSNVTQTMVLSNSGNNLWGTYGTTERPSNSNIKGQGWQILTLIRTTSGHYFRNGSADGTFADASGQPGHIGGDAATAQLVSGKIAEIIVYNTNITDANRQLNEGYLAHKWGLTASLPSNHPYKTVAPTL
jgi:hypothetical protein